MSLKNIIEKTDTTAGWLFDIFIQCLIVISLISFSIETIPNLTESTQTYLNKIEAVTVFLFTIEYLLRVTFADNRLHFIFSFYGIIDLIAVLPFYISTGIDLRAIRILRLFRIVRIFKFLRYIDALERLKLAFLIIKEELILYLIATGIMIFLSSVGIYYFESEVQPKQFASVFHCLWWSVVTLTTVGYGDVYPITVGGKVFTSIILFLGLGIVAVPTGLFASALTTVKKKDSQSK